MLNKSTVGKTSGHQTPGTNTPKGEGKPLRKRARVSTQKSGSSKLEDQNVDGPENQSNKKLNAKKGRPDSESRRFKGTEDIPFEVVLEVFCRAEPGDLLRLSRTSKDIRAILMSRRYAYIWRSARQNIGLPPPPDDMNEPQFAHLVFDDVFCYVTNLSSLPDYDWEYLCQQPADYRELRLSVLPSESVQVEQERVLVGSNKYGRTLKTEFELLKSELEREEWISQKQKELKANQEHAKLCVQWFRSTLSGRSKELEALRTERREDIIGRFDAIGWGEEARIMANEYGNEFSTHKFVRQTKKLTDLVWRRISHELLNLLVMHKTDRLRKEKETTRREHYAAFSNAYIRIRDTLDLRQPLPAVGDILKYEPIEDIIWLLDRNIDDAYSSSKISEHLPDIIAEWRPKKTQELADLLGITGATALDLHLATSVFECKAEGCGARFRFFGASRMQTWKPGHSRAVWPWSTRWIDSNNAISRVSKIVVEACGLDPAVATVQDLYDANPLIECTTCAGAKGSRYFTWWPLILSHPPSHTIKIHSSCSAAVKSEIALKFPSSDENLSCSHCHSTILKESMRSHLETTHSIQLVERQNLLVLDLQAIQEHWYFPLLPQYEHHKSSMSLFEPGYYKIKASLLGSP
ncbi:hypothetical protein BDP27DRAFT_1325714 [Rhodocollybia butyracea]|uniref:F-box domain-containing protein n=1 Tax=Rhodocollybia butyracea TaxID=206335 RepID=A0A9P5U8V3_9AGAR|nr:hypothetical protein BDP27DRAFT_1325714 [Rhodocollybia butyracea]